MESLKRYNNLTNEEVSYLDSYIVFRKIYYDIENYNLEVDDNKMVKLKDIILDVYYHSDSDLSINNIANYVLDKYSEKEVTIEELLNCSSSDIENAITKNNINFILKSEQDLDL